MQLPFLNIVANSEEQVPLFEKNGIRHRGGTGFGEPAAKQKFPKLTVKECTREIPEVFLSHYASFAIPFFAFLAAIVSFVVAGAFAVAYPPLPVSVIGEFDVPADSQCLRIFRTADHVSVLLNTGTPLAMLEVLVRFDRVIDQPSEIAALRLFSSRIAESKTVSCDNTSMCIDAAILQENGPLNPSSRAVINFAYTNPSMESITSGNTAYALGLDGEMFLQKGNDYYLTATHLCSKEVTDLANQYNTSHASMFGFVENGQIITSAATLSANSFHYSNTPVFAAQKNDNCKNDTLMNSVRMFPHQAGIEASWLGLGSERMYEYAGSGIESRRTVVEIGSHCANTYDEYERAYSLFQLDCQAYNVPCETHPTIPFRRIAKTQFRMLITENGEVFQWVFDDPRLHSLPKFSDSSDAVWMALLKLGMMLLTAGIVWIRSAKAASSPDWLYIHSLRAAFLHSNDDTVEDNETPNHGWEDAFIGLVAIAARHGVVQWRAEGLGLDNQFRVYLIEVVASILSFIHWVLRYFAMEVNKESPITKLGGSTAMIDASCAVMLAFADPPLMLTSMGRFDPTARLLIALLITLTAVQRCMFASAGCAVRWAAVYHSSNCTQVYKIVSFCAIFQWSIQAVSLGIVISDIFVTPASYSLCRAVVGEYSLITLALFFSLLVVGMPQLLSTSKRVNDAAL